MKNNFKFLTELMKLRLSHIMTFRLGFFGPFFIDTSYFLVQLFAFEAIYGHVDKIRGWGHGEILVFVGTFSLINALNMIIYFFGVISIPEKIQTGELDLYLTKPVNPLLRITFDALLGRAAYAAFGFEHPRQLLQIGVAADESPHERNDLAAPDRKSVV